MTGPLIVLSAIIVPEKYLGIYPLNSGIYPSDHCINLDLCICIIPRVGFYGRCGEISINYSSFPELPPPPLLLPTASMNASTAGDFAPSGRTVGGRHVNTGGRRGRGPPHSRLPSWQRDPRLKQNHGSQAAMAATAAPPDMPSAAVAAPAPCHAKRRRCNCCTTSN